MTPARLVGPKIRERRRSLGLTQAALSQRLAISASYLNLIEAGKRSIGGALLKRVAAELGLALDELDGAAERRLLADLGELAADPVLADLKLDAAAATELAGEHADWARALVLLHRAWLDRGQVVSALSDRLNQDPFLGDAVHSLLTRASAIRSSAEILETVDDLGRERQQRFASIIGSESRRLAEVAQALASFFHKDRAAARSNTLAGEVEDFFIERGNHFPALEESALGIRAAACAGGHCSVERLAAYLEHEHGIRSDARATRFELARRAADLHRPEGPLAAELRASTLLTSDAARRRASLALSRYVAAAVLMPYDEFLAAARELRYDVDALAGQFGTSFEQVCHRLVTLRRPGAEGIPFGLLRIDAAGFASKRFPLPHLPLPRYGSACPLWAVYQAPQSPGAVVRQLAEFPGGERFLLVARTLQKRGPAFPMPRRLVSVMLACDALYGDQTIYGDGLDLSSSAPATPVGANCRVCVRTACAYRQEDPVIDA
jgi:predicted transcriptional regulator/transcriptional regulator with XRE-family HTH domain